MLASHTFFFFFFFNDTATTEIYTLSLHDALPILFVGQALLTVRPRRSLVSSSFAREYPHVRVPRYPLGPAGSRRSEEHTSELQSRLHLVCRLLLEKKKKTTIILRRIVQI